MFWKESGILKGKRISEKVSHLKEQENLYKIVMELLLSVYVYFFIFREFFCSNQQLNSEYKNSPTP